MTERGLSEAMIKNIVESPIVTLSQWNGERLLFIGQEGAAVVEKSTGMVRTTWGVSNFGKYFLIQLASFHKLKFKS